MIDKRHLPLIVFAACVVLGLVLAALTGAWPTALAIALAGCALGLAMRPPVVENHDTAFLEEDIADLRATVERQGEDIAILRTSIDEMADIVESIATDMQRLPAAAAASDTEEIEKLRAAIDVTGRRVAALDAPREQAFARLDALDQAVASLRSDRDHGEAVADMQPVEPVALAATGTDSRMRMGGGGSGGASMSLVDRAGPLRERFPRAPVPRKVRAIPLFDSKRDPASLLIDDPSQKPSADGAIAALRHALMLVGASEDADARIFVRFSPEALGDPALADAIGPVLEEAGAAVARVVVLVRQASIKDGPPPALALLMDAGGRFGLERITDWSADLDALAARGLAVIAVDGPAMAKSAISQKGDPTRLRQVLHARGIDLLAGEIDTRMQLDAVNTLVPDLLAGAGLGEATLMDVPA